MEQNAKIYIAGHSGLVGTALCERLTSEGYSNFLLKRSSEVDLRQQSAVNELFQTEKPEYVILLAAKVGGILANDTYSAEFIYDNLMIESNVINAAHTIGVEKLLFMGSSCIYPKLVPQPMKEEYLLSGPLEPTNDAYAVAKIAGIKLCQAYRKQYGDNFIAVMPTNLYGPHDNFDLENSHVLPALIRKFHEAKINNQENVTLWGTGSPKREFLYTEDLADALIFLMQNYDDAEIVNIGVGQDISIKELAGLIKEITGYKGTIEWDTSKPDGTPRKLLDVSQINSLGWQAKTSLKQGITETYQWFVSNYDVIRK